jgi:PST family polysaccharide transporter
MISSLLNRLKQSEAGRLYSGVAHNVFALGTLQAFNYLVPVVTIPYLVRTLGVDRFGAVAFASAFVQYFIRITDYGFNLSSTREVAVHRNDLEAVSRTASAVLAVRLMLGCLCIAVATAATYLNRTLAQQRALILLSLLMVVASSISTTYLFQGMERMKYITLLGVGSKAIYFVGLVALVHHSSDYIWVPAISGGADVLGGIAGIVLSFRTFGLKLTPPNPKMIWEQLKSGWAVFTSMMAITAYSVTPTFAIGMFADTTAAGYYAIAERILTPLQLFPLGPIGAALYPRLSHIYGTAPALAYRLMRRSQNLTTAAYVVITPILILLAPAMVHVVAGQAYPTTTLVLRILLVSVFFIQANAFYAQFLLVANDTGTYARIHLVTAVLGCAAIIASARIFSLLGPAISQTGISIVILIWTMWVIFKMGRVIRPEMASSDNATEQPGPAMAASAEPVL